MSVNIPLTGAGGTTATIATEQVTAAEFQFIKLANGVAGSSVAASVLATTPASDDPALVVRTIGSTAYAGAVVIGTGGTTGNTVGSVALLGGTTANSLGSVALLGGSSANTLGSVVVSSVSNLNLAIGSSATYQFVQSIPFSSGNISRTSVSTTVDIQIIAANASRKALIIANRSTVQTVGIGFSTAILTTALANVDFFIGQSAAVSFGLQGGLPLALGPLRGINLTSTTVAGSVGVIEFT
jgi:hypothetical protein